MVGMRPIVDLMLTSFMYCAMDQIISIISRSTYLYGGQASLPLTIRASMFYGGSNAAQHSDRPLAEDGLVVGVLRNVGDLALTELSARRKALTERVRAGRASVTELQGSTFTISNLGRLGIDAFTPIINPPEVAILGVGRITDQPAPSDAGITWRKSMTLSLTVDHRAVDGAPAARFLAGVADRLQAPAAL
jgi:pyruvate/2-oxoglutarate dehydrogenase complex dihydrolipoamide acyltransferase (E2) component